MCKYFVKNRKFNNNNKSAEDGLIVLMTDQEMNTNLVGNMLVTQKMRSGDNTKMDPR
jgi:hypothetical protein